MNLLMVGSASQYAKHAARKTQWNLKKQSGDLTGHKKSLGDYVNITKASSVLPQTDEADSKMSAIMTKAQAGKKLSYDEWEYLRAKNPVMYEKLREVEKEQEAYEEELKRCKTKDEARRLHMSKLADILTAAKNGDESALVRLNRLTQTMTEFTKSDEYHELPTEAEEAIERAREEALRLEAEIRNRAEQEADTETESVEETEPVTDTESESVAETEAAPVTDTESKTKPVTDTESKPVANTKAKPVTDTESKPVRKTKAESVRKPNAAFKFGAPSPEPSFGRREYVHQRDGLSRDDSRRRAFDADA
ncbi:MAG: hypothetical protein IJQ25_05065 [Oscillibacter sp.]|nr:hypothetical protein [Oscillibacter sp.]